MNNYIKGSFDWLKRFFFNYLWLGVSLLLISIIIDLSYPQKSTYISILYKLIEGIGVSILIASIFSYASSTYDFVERIRGLLEDIIIKRNFLGNIDPEGKKEALKSLIQPTNSEINKYPNIGNYYGYFINKTLEIAQKSVRSNYQVHARAYVDQSTNHIAVDGTYSYRLYPCSEGYHDITVGHPVDDVDKNKCEQVIICTPEGKRQIFKYEDLTFNNQNDGGDISIMAKVPVAEIGKGHDCLDVELSVKEFGSVNSFLYSFKALQPTDGFKLHLFCQDSLFIKSHAVFVVGANYYLDVDESKKSLTITCNQWINEGTGIAILIALPDATSLSDGTPAIEPSQNELSANGNIEPIAIEDPVQENQVAG